MTAPDGQLLGPRSWRWTRPWGWNHSHWNGGLGAAKYAATTRSGKSIVSGIHGQGRNISADRNEAATDVSPITAIICRPENAAGSGCENITTRVKCYCVSIERSETVILF